MNKYSRRYKCPDCGLKGKATRIRADTGMINCPDCKAIFPADELFRGNDNERSIQGNKGEV